jgi:hypothetical protein
MINKRIISLISIPLIFLLLPFYAFAVTYEQCITFGGGTGWNAGDCTCPSGKTWSGDSCVSNNYNGSGGTVETSTEASQCLSAKCAVPSNVNGSTVAPTYNYSTGACSCPSGYSSSDVDMFNSTRGISSGGSSGGSSDDGSTGGGSSSGGSSGSSSSSTFSYETTTSSGTINNPVSYGSFDALLDAVITWIRNIALVVAPLVIVYGGFTYMTAMGDTAKITKGKNIILYAAIGLMIAILAQSLLAVIAGFTK